MKEETFRLTGIDVEMKPEGCDRGIELSQDFYVDELSELAVSQERLRGDPETAMTPSEMAACRAALGALQWVSTQTQTQASARVNLLLTELTTFKTIAVAKGIAELIKDLKKSSMTIRLHHLPHVTHWQEFSVVTLADQAHNNRPQGGSTGGVLTMMGGPEQLRGEAGRLSPVSWRTWKLRRKAISTNDGELQFKQPWRVKTAISGLDGCGVSLTGALRSKMAAC